MQKTKTAPVSLRPLLTGANHIDVKSIVSDVTLRTFIAGFISYMPVWIRALYAVRWAFVRLLGMRQHGLPQGGRLQPDDVPMRSGEKLAFFTVELVDENAGVWAAGVHESHLSAHLAIVATPLDGKRKQFDVYTIVRYHRWTGPVYFNVIRPFHHLVVGSMMRAGAG